MFMVALLIAMQQTTDCNSIGDALHCTTSPQPQVNWKGVYHPDFGAAALAGVQTAEAIRQQREQEESQRQNEALLNSTPTNGGLPSNRPTAREIYVGCSLMLERSDVIQSTRSDRFPPFSAKTCNLLIDYYSKTHHSDPPNMQTCPPSDLADKRTEFAIVYINFYNRNAEVVAPMDDGPTAFDIALAEKWPCQGH